MVLASQMARSDSMRRTTSRRRRLLSQRRVVIAGLLAIFGVWYFWPGGREAEPGAPLAAVTPSTNASAAPQGAAPAPTSAPAAAPPVAAPPARADNSATRNVPGSPEFLARIKAALEAQGARGSTAAAAPVADSASGSTSGAAAEKSPKPAVLDLGAAAKTTPPATPPADPAAPPAALTPPAKPADPATPPAPLPDLNRVAFTTTGSAGEILRAGMNQIADGKFVDGRKTLSALLAKNDPALSALDAQTIRDTLASINKNLIFSSQAASDDPLVELYAVQSSDLLSTVARKHKVTYPLLEQINHVDARRIRVGQKIKIIKGPFHALVDKSDFRMDLFLKDADGLMNYITSFPVGVGKDDSTPVGHFLCRPAGKLTNPGWTDPRTSQYFAPDDPRNPIGEFWIALDGADEATKGLRGYGVHGTVDPGSIGKQMSLGCVRLLPKDIEMVYKLLADGQSTVTIQP